MSETSPNPLDNLHIASPCHASWDAMTGDDQARFCKTCNKNVFNLTVMTRAEAENLIRVKEGNLCVRYSQREDGTILTQDCPVGFERARQQALRPFRFAKAGIAAVIAAISSLLGLAPRAVAQPPLNTTAHARQIMGDMAMPVQQKVKAPSATTMTGRPAPAAKMGEAEVCTKPPEKMIMGKPSAALLQGGLQGPVTQATPKAVDKPHVMMMGSPAGSSIKAIAPVKAVEKAKKHASKVKRAGR